MEEPRRDWPALMDLSTAGDYLKLSRGSLLRLLKRQNVEAVDVGAKLRRWRRRDLDELLSRLPPYGSGMLRTSFPTEGAGPDAALAAVERRAHRRGTGMDGRSA